VVNDGSTDNTSEILNKFGEIEIVSYAKNKGKGNALRRGFRKAFEKGYSFAVTIDSDGQHDPQDIYHFLEAYKKNPETVIVGARKTIEGDVPGKNSFANRFSNFWFAVITGNELEDTQSGYRLYPLKKIGKMKFVTTKYEFELEVLIRAIWKNIPVISIPIKAIYPPKGERITHFRPWRDFFRISVLNTVMVFLALSFFRPFAFLRSLNRKNLRDFNEKVFHSKENHLKIVLSAMLGIFMGIIPIWGYQLVSAIALAYLLKLNKFVVIVTANISIPPMIPVLLYLSYITGGFVMGKGFATLSFSQGLTLEFFKTNIEQYLIGSIIFAIVAALGIGLITFIFLKLFTRR
jgi:glycosyltransferase involved in cell wall biosynthesis